MQNPCLPIAAVPSKVAIYYLAATGPLPDEYIPAGSMSWLRAPEQRSMIVTERSRPRT
jgi:hypothetical protein